MKKLRILRLLSIFTIAAAGVLAGAIFKSDKQSTKVDAASITVSGTRVQVEDVTNQGWTGSGKSYAVLDIYDVDFGSSNYSYSDIVANDLECQSFATGSSYLHVEMKKTPNAGETFYAVLPWYMNSFKVKFYATENGTDRYWYQAGANYQIERSVTKGTNWIFKSDSNRAGWGGSNFYTDVTTYKTDEGTFTYSFYGIYSGSHMYMSISDISGWEWDSAKLAINFCRSNVNLNGAWSSQYSNTTRTSATMSECFAWKVNGSNDQYLYECIVPQYQGQNVYWSCVIGVRFNSSTASPGWSNNVLNKTGDQFYNADDYTCNMLWVNAATGGSWSGGGYIRTDKTISDDTRAGYYGTYFISEITCSGSGSITSPSSNWSNVKSEYNQHLSTAVQGKVWTTTAAASGTDLVKAMYRYDYIVFHKGYSGYDDFINRAKSSGKSFSSSNVSALLFGKNINANIIVIASISIIAVSTIGGYFFYKRRKENI